MRVLGIEPSCLQDRHQVDYLPAPFTLLETNMFKKKLKQSKMITENPKYISRMLSITSNWYRSHHSHYLFLASCGHVESHTHSEWMHTDSCIVYFVLFSWCRFSPYSLLGQLLTAWFLLGLLFLLCFQLGNQVEISVNWLNWIKVYTESWGWKCKSGSVLGHQAMPAVWRLNRHILMQNTQGSEALLTHKSDATDSEVAGSWAPLMKIQRISKY